MSLTREMIELGPRPPGSAGLQQVRELLGTRISSFGLTMQSDPFTAATPIGDIEMQNLSVSVPGKTGNKRVLLIAHYESKRFVGFDFVGANDAASSVALLITLLPEIVRRQYPFDVEVVLVDGEEALVRWTPTDSLYGSRHLASQLATGKEVQAALVVDMVGDIDLSLINSADSHPQLKALLLEVVTAAGKRELVETNLSNVQDDHTPLAAAGIPVLHLMDYTYGGSSSPGTYWHTSEDTIDKLSSDNLARVGDLLLGLLDRLGQAG